MQHMIARVRVRSTVNQNFKNMLLRTFSSILPSLHNRTHSKVEAWARWSARPKIES